LYQIITYNKYNCKMKKIILTFFALLCVSVFSVNAGVKFGLKAGANLANVSFSQETIKPDNYTGFHAGIITEISLPVVGLGFDVAVLYSQQGLKIKDLNFEEKKSVINVPVNLKFKFDVLKSFGIYLTAGPYVNFKLKGDNFSLEMLQRIATDFEQKSFGAGLNFGFGVELFSHLQVGANYQLGLTDDYSSTLNTTLTNSLEELKGQSRIWSISAAYFF